MAETSGRLEVCLEIFAVCLLISWFTSEATLVPGEKKRLLDVSKTLFCHPDLDICTITAFSCSWMYCKCEDTERSNRVHLSELTALPLNTEDVSIIVQAIVSVP